MEWRGKHVSSLDRPIPPTAFDTVRVDNMHHLSRQAKLAASFFSPAPLYTATLGYGQSGCERSATPPLKCVATTVSGGMPCSTHCSRAVCISKVFGADPSPL